MNKRLTLEELKAKGVSIIANSNAIKGGNLDKCHPEEEKRGGCIPAQY